MRSAVENIKGTEYAVKVLCVPTAIVVRDARWRLLNALMIANVFGLCLKKKKGKNDDWRELRNSTSCFRIRTLVYYFNFCLSIKKKFFCWLTLFDHFVISVKIPVQIFIVCDIISVTLFTLLPRISNEFLKCSNGCINVFWLKIICKHDYYTFWTKKSCLNYKRCTLQKEGEIIRQINLNAYQFFISLLMRGCVILQWFFPIVNKTVFDIPKRNF